MGGIKISEYPIELRGLSKSYGKFTAVHNLNLSVKKNSFTGFLGPNGAGKSTSLKILTNLIRPSSGSAYLNGINVSKDPKRALQDVGAVVETPEFYTYLTPRKTLKYLGRINGIPNEILSNKIEEVLESVKMTEWGDKKIGTFSKGMRQRIALGQALLDEPSVILLDEPTSGLDPRGTAEMRDILKGLKKNNLTVLMSSHMLHEVSDLCDRIAMINHGNLLIHDDTNVVVNKGGTRKINIKFLNEISSENFERISNLSNVIKVETIGKDMELHLEGNLEQQSRLLTEIDRIGIGMHSFSEDSNALENVYLEMIKERS